MPSPALVNDCHVDWLLEERCVGLFSFPSYHFSFSTPLLTVVTDSSKAEQVEVREEGKEDKMLLI